MLSPKNKTCGYITYKKHGKTQKNKDITNNNKNCWQISLNLINLLVIKENVLKDTYWFPILWMNEWELNNKSLWSMSQAQELLKDFSHNTSLCVFTKPIVCYSQLLLLFLSPKPCYHHSTSFLDSTAKEKTKAGALAKTMRCCPTVWTTMLTCG